MTKFMSVLSNGYLALYVGLQNDSYSNSNFVNVLFPIVFGLAITFGNNALKTRYILLFFIHALLNILMGTRSAFGAFLLICLWIYSMTHQISLKKIFFWCLLSIVMLLFVYSFSIRANEQGVSNESLIDKMLFFAFSQGGTLMTFDSSRLVENYPIIPYFQSFFPGAANIFSFLTGEELYHWNTSFSGYMDYQLNPDLYFSGCGLGWSILSDLYLFSGGTWIIFFFLSLIYGMFIAVLEKKAIHCNFFKYLGVSISYSLVLLPRGSLSSLFPLLIYSVFIWVIFLFCFQAWDKIREIKYYNKCNRRIN